MFDNQFPPINWQKAVKIAQWASFLTLFFYVGLESSAAIDADSNRVLAYQKISGMIRELALFVIDFARPFVEIILFFLVAHWAIRRFDIQFTIPPVNDWKVANIIVLLVIGSFILLLYGD